MIFHCLKSPHWADVLFNLVFSSSLHFLISPLSSTAPLLTFIRPLLTEQHCLTHIINPQRSSKVWHALAVPLLPEITRQTWRSGGAELLELSQSGEVQGMHQRPSAGNTDSCLCFLVGPSPDGYGTSTSVLWQTIFDRWT